MIENDDILKIRIPGFTDETTECVIKKPKIIKRCKKVLKKFEKEINKLEESL